MNSIKISIVMPVHNTGIYLEEALESVFAQSFREFEVICVDDASDDELTSDILSRFQKQYENMQVLKLGNNAGAGEARNRGLSQACGQYVIFLDADDVFAEDMLERMYQSVYENDADVCICGFQAFYIENGKKYFRDKCLPDEYKIYHADREDWFLVISTEPWNKLCRIQYLKDNGIYFQSLASCNDVFFSCMVMTNAGKRCYVDGEPLVFYRTKVENQISAKRNPVDLYKAVALVNESEHVKVDREQLLKWSSALLLWNGIGELVKSNHEENRQRFYYLLREFCEKHAICFQNKVLNALVENVKNRPYESNWFYGYKEFKGQLRLTADELKEKLREKKPLFLWGLGCRGDVFQQFCKEEKICLYGVTDITQDCIGQNTKYGNKIVSNSYVLQGGGFIIASNKRVYDYLIEQNAGLSVLNLEMYCPI